MWRVLIILLLALFLLPAPHANKPSLKKAGPLIVTATRLPLDSQTPGRTRLGPLIFRGAWHLRSDEPSFGGISALHVRDDGSILALNDTGILMGFDVEGRSHARPFIAPLPLESQDRRRPRWKWDSESMIYDPATDRYWVGFELIQRICRYAPGFSRVEDCVSPREMKDWDPVGGAEAMARLPDGRFLIFSEMSDGPGDIGKDVLLYAGDPVERSGRPVRLSYMPPDGFVPTDAVVLDSRRLIMLNRRFALDGFSARLTLVTLPQPLKAGSVLKGREIARFNPPVLTENYEGLSISHEGGKRMLWIVADDNHQFYQRSLLLKFEIPAGFGG